MDTEYRTERRKTMLKIGCHLSASNGYLAMGKDTVSIEANTFQFFTRNPRGGSARPVDEADINNFKAFAGKTVFLLYWPMRHIL